MPAYHFAYLLNKHNNMCHSCCMNMLTIIMFTIVIISARRMRTRVTVVCLSVCSVADLEIQKGGFKEIVARFAHRNF